MPSAIMNATATRSTLPYLFVVVAAIIADQISKWAILAKFDFAERLPVIPNFFDLTLLFNPGAAFSFWADQSGWQKYFFLLMAVLVSVYLWRAIVRHELAWKGSLGAALIIGGGLGNAIDRLVHGHVVDFLLFYGETWSYPAFNIADSCICVGAALFLIDNWKNNKNQTKNDVENTK